MIFALPFILIFLAISAAWWWWLVIKPLYRFRKGQEVSLIGPALTLALAWIGIPLYGSWAPVIIIGPWVTLLAVPDLLIAVFGFPEFLAGPLLGASILFPLAYFGFRRFKATRRYALIPATLLAVIVLPLGIDRQVGSMMQQQMERQGGTCLARHNIISSMWIASEPFRFSFHAVTLIDGKMHAWSYEERLFFIVDPSAEVYGAELMERCE